jgi:hypothetical protein
LISSSAAVAPAPPEPGVTGDVLAKALTSL